MSETIVEEKKAGLVVSEDLTPNEPVIKNRVVRIRVRDGVGMPGAEEINRITRRLSSVYTGNGNKSPLNPLSWEECEAWMPSLINIEKKDNAFRQGVEDYFVNISVPIALGEAYELEVGMEYDSQADFAAEKVSFDIKTGVMTGKLTGRPINIPDYILYRFALRHPKVANRKEFIYSSDKIWFYIEDLAQNKEEEEKLALNQHAAQTVFISKVSSDETLQVGIINACLNEKDLIKIDKLAEQLTFAERIVAINAIISKSPERFISLARNVDLGFVSLIHLALFKGILKKMPNTEIITFENEQGVANLGTGVKEVIAFLKHERNVVIKNQIEIRIKGLK